MANSENVKRNSDKTSLDSELNEPSAHSGASCDQVTMKYKTAVEYSRAVHQWLVQYHLWNQMNWFYMTFPMQMVNMNTRLQAPYSYCGSPSQSYTPLQSAGSPVTTNSQQNGAERVTRQTLQCKIPPLWKRVTAEFIDFFLLFITKLMVTIFFVEYIGLIELHHYDLEYLMTTDMDYNTAFTMTSELVAMEVVNRVFICIFETLCLRKGLAGTVGGTTPGKRMMGLKVISCREVSSLVGRQVLVSPAGNIGTWNAFVRSLIKNFSLAFFFPVCLTVFFFQHNRAAYDIISNSIVVETAPLMEQRAR